MFLKQSTLAIARCVRLPIVQCSSASRFLSMSPTTLLPVSPARYAAVLPSFPVRSYSSSDSSNDAVKRVGELVKASRIVIFMKGDPDEPRCGFSNAVCRILEMHGILDRARQAGNHDLFSSYNILADEDLRTAAKVYADWPTFPQVFFDGEFVGGCDILLDMHRSGKLTSELERLGIGSALKDVSTKEST